MGRAEPGGVLAARYRLRTVLHRDEVGSVWLASDGLLHRDVAVRPIPWAPHPGDAEQESPYDRPLRDARALAKLDHPNIPVVFDVVQDDGRPWMVLEAAPYRFPYRSLREVVRNDGPLEPQRAAQVGYQILAALRAAHAVGVLHRDIRPGSVLLGRANRVMLTGFGMVTADGGPAAPENSAVPPCYLAPECASGQPATPAADLWSLGATLYAAVEGRPPFDGDGREEILTAVVTGYLDRPRRAGPLWPVISALLRKDASARPDAAGLVWLLLRVAGARAAAGAVPAPESAGWPAGAAPVTGGRPQVRQDRAAPAATATAQSQARAADAGRAGSADFIPGFGPREPALPREAPEHEDPPAEEPVQPGRKRRRKFFATSAPGS